MSKHTAAELNQMQETFILEYHKTGLKKQSAVTAGYSEKSAASQANKLLKKSKIKARLKELQDEIADENKITTDRLVKNLLKIAENPDAKDADIISANREIGRLSGLYDPENVLNADITIQTINYSDIKSNDNE